MVGIGAIVVAIVGFTTWRVLPDERSPDLVDVSLITSQIGEGIAQGTDVRLDGVNVGSVTAIDLDGQHRQRIALSLQRSQLFGLTNALTIDYVPGNIFGISSLQLNKHSGGTVLGDGTTVDLTGRQDGVADATLSTLLKSTGQLTDSVLTPKLADLLAQLAHDVNAFTPLLQAIGTTARSFAETQQLPPSFLLDQYGSALGGAAPMLTGGLQVVYSAYTNKYLSDPARLARYADMFDRIKDQLLPIVTDTANTGRQHFSGFTPIATAILDRLATMGTSEHSAQQLSELLDRLDRSFADTPNGPTLKARVDLDVVPGLAGPLSALVGHPLAGGR